MKDHVRKNSELIEEIAVLKRRIKELEQSASERERTEEALNQAREFLSLAIAAGGVGIWDCNSDSSDPSPSRFPRWLVSPQ